MKYLLTIITIFIVTPTVLLGFIDSKFSSLVYILSFCFMMIFCGIAFFISNKMKNKKTQSYIKRYEKTHNLNTKSYFCAFDANELEDDIKNSYFENFKDKKIEVVYGIVLEVTSNPHVGTEIHYWSKGQKQQCTAWRKSSFAKEGTFIKLTLVDNEFVDGSIYKSPIKIELESAN